MEETSKMIAPPERCFPPPYEPANYVVFDFFIGQKVTTIWGEPGTVESMMMGRGGVPQYFVQVSIDSCQWLHFDQIKDNRWEPFMPGPYPLRRSDEDASPEA